MAASVRRWEAFVQSPGPLAGWQYEAHMRRGRRAGMEPHTRWLCGHPQWLPQHPRRACLPSPGFTGTRGMGALSWSLRHLCFPSTPSADSPLLTLHVQHPRIAAVTGIVAVLASILGLFNPRGQPFVFHFEVQFPRQRTSLPCPHAPLHHLQIPQRVCELIKHQSGGCVDLTLHLLSPRPPPDRCSPV